MKNEGEKQKRRIHSLVLHVTAFIRTVISSNYNESNTSAEVLTVLYTIYNEAY